MSYNNNGYGQPQQQQQGYGQYNPYGQSGNPYGQPQGGQAGYSDNIPYGNQGNYSNRPDPERQASSRYDEESQTGGYEMNNMPSRDPNRILNEVRNTDRAITDVENDMSRLETLRKTYLRDTDDNLAPTIKQLDEEIFDKLRALMDRTKRIRSDPESDNIRNKAQVGKLKRRIEEVKNRNQRMETEFSKARDQQIARDVRVTNPEATDAEIQQAITNGPGQVFTQALMSSDRRGQAQSALNRTRQRHEEIQRIEQQMAELARLFNELEAIVVQQEPAVTNIEQKGEEVTDHVAKANTELDGAVKKARSARKKKWICLGIVVLICILIALGIGLGVGIATRNK